MSEALKDEGAVCLFNADDLCVFPQPMGPLAFRHVFVNEGRSMETFMPAPCDIVFIVTRGSFRVWINGQLDERGPDYGPNERAGDFVRISAGARYRIEGREQFATAYQAYLYMPEGAKA